MKQWLRNALAFALGACVGVIMIEGVLRQFPVPMGLYRTEQYQRWPLVNYEPRMGYTSSMSWDMRHVRRGSTNNYGQLAPFDYLPRSRPVIVIGDSFVGAAMNRYEDTLQGQLGALLGRREAVYGLGANGLSLSDYLALSSLAATEFSPRAAVILLIDGDVSESLLSQLGHYSFVIKNGAVTLNYRPLYGETFGKKMRRLFGDSALYRYIQLNLHFDPTRLLEQVMPNRPSSASSELQRSETRNAAERSVIDHFLAQVTVTLQLPSSCVALLFHTDTYALADPAAALKPKDAPQLMEYFRTQANAMGYRIVNLHERFQSDYALHGKRLDYWPLDRHLNGRGHGIAARSAFDALFNPETGKPCQPNTGKIHSPAFTSNGLGR